MSGVINHCPVFMLVLRSFTSGCLFIIFLLVTIALTDTATGTIFVGAFLLLRCVR